MTLDIGRKLPRMYSTKYFLTRGIVEYDNLELVKGAVEYAASYPDNVFERIGKDIFYTKEEALQRADEICSRRLKALDRQRRVIAMCRENIAKMRQQSDLGL